ncbi:MAG: MarR family transcriptional regulator [Prevotellaceae bacterium]|jgi:DNA-binding MarR family transcriptional regulator|nr:MarR family transcriptional regulator [Prevotellaceae bacterium]
MDKKKVPVSLSIAQTLKAIEHAFRKSIQELNLNLQPESFGILMMAYYQDNLTQQDIAEMAKKDKSAVLRQIDTLESNGLVQRMADVQDRRKNLIAITDSGKSVVGIIIRKERALLETLSQGVEQQEMETFIKVLLQLKGNAEKL